MYREPRVMLTALPAHCRKCSALRPRRPFRHASCQRNRQQLLQQQLLRRCPSPMRAPDRHQLILAKIIVTLTVTAICMRIYVRSIAVAIGIVHPMRCLSSTACSHCRRLNCRRAWRTFNTLTDFPRVSCTTAGSVSFAAIRSRLSRR